MLKWIRWIAMALSVVSMFAWSSQVARADDPPGAKAYATYCAACHGAGGKGGMAPAIGAEQYLSSKDDATITRITGEGVAGKGMPAWSKAKGGALTDDQIASIVAYLRSPAAAANVSAPGALANAFLEETKLFVMQSDSPTGEIVLTVLLQEYTGSPIANASIVFTRATAWGVVEVATAKTGANGIAKLTISEIPSNTRAVTAVFKGDKKYDAATRRIELDARTQVASSSDVDTSYVQLSIAEPLLPPDGNLITPNPPLLPTVLLALIVGCVWTTYGYVLYQAYRIRKNSRIEPKEDTRPQWR